MTEVDAIEKLKALDNVGDTEAEHLYADKILCEFLRSAGYGALADQFYEQAKGYWYA